MRVAVISPFVDRQHGTERVLAEQLGRLARWPETHVHLYAQRVDGLEVRDRNAQEASGIVWHRVPSFFGPHLLQFAWWFIVNSLQRAADRMRGKVRADVVFSPGINALDADVIAVHIVFHAFYEQVIGQLRLASVPWRWWPRRLHRRIYYRSIMALERRIYRDPRVRLLPVSQLVARQIREHFGRTDLQVVANGVSAEEFHPAARNSLRSLARRQLQLSPENFVLLLIGNDWIKKGLRCLLRAVRLCADRNLRLLVVGDDDPGLFAKEMEELAVASAVCFLPPRPDVLFYYAAADAYTGPSLEDAFGLPILEAMACGLPVIASRLAGASEAVRDGVNGMILNEPESAEELAGKIGALSADGELRERLGAAAAEIAQKYSWESNAALLRDVLVETARSKKSGR